MRQRIVHNIIHHTVMFNAMYSFLPDYFYIFITKTFLVQPGKLSRNDFSSFSGNSLLGFARDCACETRLYGKV